MNDIDFNCDLGEGSGMDAAIMPFISSCNIACGGHAGNEASIRETLFLAEKYGVKIGAHPSYQDPENFGRKILHLSPAKLTHSLVDQVRLLEGLASTFDLGIHHIKLHGALYHQAARDTPTAQLIVKMMEKYFPRYLMYVPHPSVLSLMAHQQGVQIKYEAFADRKYNTDLSLVGREHPHASKWYGHKRNQFPRNCFDPTFLNDFFHLLKHLLLIQQYSMGMFPADQGKVRTIFPICKCFIFYLDAWLMSH